MTFVSLLLAMGIFFIIYAIISIIGYVIASISTYRVLNICRYKNKWMAWAPYLRYYSLADVVCEKKPSIKFISFELPSILFKFWWVLIFVNSFTSDVLPELDLQLVSNVISILVILIKILFSGNVYSHVYAKIEGKTYSETMLLGFLSGLLPIIAYIKFLRYDKNMRLNRTVEDSIYKTY